VAVRHNASTAVHYLLTDHLGSTALTLDQNGARYNTNTELRYYPYGVTRYTAGTTPTTFNFTGQRKDSGSGLLFYQARWYDPVVGRFLQPDTIIPSPGDPQSLNRYSYTLNNPLKYTDSSGHWVESALDLAFIGYDIYDIQANGLTWTSGLSLAADVAGLALPVVTGGGLLVRGLAHADDVAKAVSHVDDVAKAASHVDVIPNAAKAAVKEMSIAPPQSFNRFVSKGELDAISETPWGFASWWTRR
jgi:RHS repeat-associated protein